MSTYAASLAEALRRVAEDGIKRVVVAYPQPNGGWDWHVMRYGSQGHLTNRAYRGLPPVRAGEVKVPNGRAGTVQMTMDKEKGLHYVVEYESGPAPSSSELQGALDLLDRMVPHPGIEG